MGSKSQYEAQLRRKIADAESQYRDLGSVYIRENAARLLPMVKRDLKAQQLRLDDAKARKISGEMVDLDMHKRLVAGLKARIADIRQIITLPRRNVKSTPVYYATISTRTLDFDGSEPSARIFGGTIVSMKQRIEVSDSAMADRDDQDNPKREWLRSDVTDEVKYLQAHLKWLRDRIAAVNTSGSTEQWLLSQPFRPTKVRGDSKQEQYIACGYGIEESKDPTRINGWAIDKKCR